MEIIIKRMVPAGSVNPNTGIEYTNMEDKLKEYFKLFNNRVPVSAKPDSDDMTSNCIDIMNVIGYATKFDDENVYIEIDEKNKILFDMINEPRAQVYSLIRTDMPDVILHILRLGICYTNTTLPSHNT